MSVHYDQGNYAVLLKAQVLSETKTGKPQIITTFQPTHIEDPSVPVDTDERWKKLSCETYQRSAYWVITEKTMKFLPDKLAKVEVKIESFKEIGKDPDLLDRQVVMVCSHEEYKGEPKERWDVPRDSSGIDAPPPLNAAATARLDALFGKHLTKPVAEPVAVAEGADGSADDMPF